MKIGNVYVTRQETLLHDPEYRKIIAKIARAEVKNYLAELAESAEMPFPSPEGYLRNLENLRKTGFAREADS